MANTNKEVYRQKLRAKILRVSMVEFRHKGVKSVKMSDIAHLLGISKRTLYEIIPDKETLLFESVKEQVKEREAQMRKMSSRPEVNVMDIIMLFLKLKIAELKGVSAKYFEDIRMYPVVTNYLIDLHKNRQEQALSFFKQGIKEGYFVPEFNYDIIMSLGNDTINFIMENKLYSHYAFDEMFNNVVVLYVRGLCTPKGIERIDSEWLKKDKPTIE